MLFVPIFLMITTSVLADAQRGRTSDGRAFRTDNNGNQIIDYIAELELGLEAKERQLQGLEQELQEKQQLVDRLRTGKAEVAGVEERDLLSHEQPSSTERVAMVPAELQKKIASCNAEMEQIRTQLAVKERQLSVFKSDLQIEQQVAGVEKGSLRGDISALQKQIAQRDELIQGQEERISSLQQEISGKELQVRSLGSVQSELERVKLENVQLVEDSKSAQLKIAKLQAETEEMKSKLVKADLASEKSEAMASLRVVSEHPTKTRKPQGLNAEQLRLKHLSESRDRAVDSLRGKLRTDLNRAQSLVKSRDAYYKKFLKTYDPKKTGLSFKPAKAVSSRRRSLASVKKGIGVAKTVYELTGYRNDIREIQGKMSDDIGLMKRLQKK
jgi:chromosome segregation ATPase